MADEWEDEVYEVQDNFEKKIKKITDKGIKKINIFVNNRKIERNFYLVENKSAFARCVGSVLWLIANTVIISLFATYGNSVFDLFISLSLPLNMVAIVMAFSGAHLDYSDEFIK